MLNNAVRSGGRSVGRRSQRSFGSGPFSHKMGAKPNKFAEEWNGRREITELSFNLSRKNVPTLILTCVILPYGVYKATSYELHETGGPKFQDTC